MFSWTPVPVYSKYAYKITINGRGIATYNKHYTRKWGQSFKLSGLTIVNSSRALKSRHIGISILVLAL